MKLGKEQRAAIVQAIGDTARAVVPELEEILEAYAVAIRDASTAARHRYPPVTLAKQRAACKRIMLAARALQRALEAAPLIVHDRIMAAMRHTMRSSTFGDWQPGDLFEEELAEVRAFAAKAGMPEKGGSAPGRKTDPLRLALEVAVARLLERHGVRVTQYDAGPHVTVLHAALEASGIEAPQERDPRPLLRRIARSCR